MSILKSRTFLALIACAAFAGCATNNYNAPGAPADMQVFAPSSVKEGFAARPLAPFPVSIALARVQAPDYSNYNLRHDGLYGTGRYVVVGTRESEDADQIERLTHLALVSGVTGLDRILLNAHLESDKDLRESASRLHADLLLVYTFDTTFHNGNDAAPLSAVALGQAPARRVAVTTTVSGLLVDTRTGYVYSTYEATKKTDTRATSWASSEAADQARRDNERAAFGDFVTSVGKTWPSIVSRYSHHD